MAKRPGVIILHKCNKNHDHMLHCSWDMARVGCNCYFTFWAIFSPSPPPPSPNISKNENFTKIIIKKTTTGGINKCTRNHDHMLYCSWDMVCDRCNCYFSIWVNSPKNENFKTMEKTPWDIIILQKCTKNHGHMLYCYWDIVRDGCNCYFSFWGIFFALLSPH